MPKRTDINSIFIIGAGPIIIGQACEFDYSGTQACKALKEEGYRIVLINSNPATIMTDPDMADATYIEPITPAMVATVLEQERTLHPNEKMALLPTMGGQTALNTALAIEENGVLEKLGIEMIGAKAHVIAKAEEREQFRKAMNKIGLECAKARQVKTMEEALDALKIVNFPAIIRPSFTLGGSGGGIAYNINEFKKLIESGLRLSPVNSVLVEESVLGWKEFEMEVVRDSADNCIIICAIENIDPMGIHTGDSITVAPALTLTDKEYQIMRNASIAVLREIGVDTGGSNVQFAIDPDSGRMLVIEMNPRVSRSSALASKATGFPIAKIAAKLAVGYHLNELKNDITRTTPAGFEPTIDYIVTKIPRFQFEKFTQTKPILTTAMHSIGETMAIGRNFAESIQKALRSLETGLNGFDECEIMQNCDKETILNHVRKPTPDRILYVAEAIRAKISIQEIHQACKIDPWFLKQIQNIVSAETHIQQNGLPKNKSQWAQIKRLGFSDERLATLSGKKSEEIYKTRTKFGITPVFKRIDTCAAEFPSHTAYIYSCYEHNPFQQATCEANVSDKNKVAILGGGPNRIGQGIEFDYCCVHAAYALSKAGYETIMINCNPETVSTDYDTSDRLYFEGLTEEDVIAILKKEMSRGTLKGVIVQFGGQTPLKLAAALEKANIPVLGTSPDAIDLAEDRERFQKLLQKLKLKQPANGTATNKTQAFEQAKKIGYPIVIRPSYVLGGRAMEIIHDDEQLEYYIDTAVKISNSPVLIDQYLHNAIEIDVDALCDGSHTYIAGIMQHIEEAGIHSGDSACVLPAFSLSEKIIKSLQEQTRQLAKALKVVGLMNIQFAIQKNEIYLLEVNPRASRTVPFIAKATGKPIAAIAARLMAGEKLVDFGLTTDTHEPLKHFAVKEAVFPFNRFDGADVTLGPEMRSTGEVMGIDKTLTAAFAKAQLAAGESLYLNKNAGVFVSVKNNDKPAILNAVQNLQKIGLKIIATNGTAQYLKSKNIKATPINKFNDGQPHIIDAMINGEIDIVFNTTEGKKAIIDSRSLRRTALQRNIPYYTTVAGINAAADAIVFLQQEKLEVQSLQCYLKNR